MHAVPAAVDVTVRAWHAVHACNESGGCHGEAEELGVRVRARNQLRANVRHGSLRLEIASSRSMAAQPAALRVRPTRTPLGVPPCGRRAAAGAGTRPPSRIFTPTLPSRVNLENNYSKWTK